MTKYVASLCFVMLAAVGCDPNAVQSYEVCERTCVPSGHFSPFPTYDACVSRCNMQGDLHSEYGCDVQWSEYRDVSYAHWVVSTDPVDYWYPDASAALDECMSQATE